uniref:Ribosomal RNA large subunit methyltransferase K/L-like methyltransferase domain-containing protein n=1 Tax=Chrysotila carterae TaxID=13221 RepID=A0A7S4BBR4_CHRCT
MRGRSDVLAIGFELCASQLQIARSNRARLFQSAAARVELMQGDARRLPLLDESVDAVICDLPFGRMHGSEEENVTLYPAVVHELARVLRKGGKAVLLTNSANVQCLLSAFGHFIPTAEFEAARATQLTESSPENGTDQHQDIRTPVGGGPNAAELINASSGKVSAQALSLKLLYCRLLPLGNTEGWAFVAMRPNADFDKQSLSGSVGAQIDAGVKTVDECGSTCGVLAQDAFESSSPLHGMAATGLATTRFEWEERKGRSLWEAKRKSHRPALVPVGTRS